jgi:hypothetical protein
MCAVGIAWVICSESLETLHELTRDIVFLVQQGDFIYISRLTQNAFHSNTAFQDSAMAPIHDS